MDNFLISPASRKIAGELAKRMRQSLKSIVGINTVAESSGSLAGIFLQQSYGKQKFGAILYDRAYGIDPRIVHAPPASQKRRGGAHTGKEYPGIAPFFHPAWRKTCRKNFRPARKELRPRTHNNAKAPSLRISGKSPVAERLIFAPLKRK